MWQMGGLGPMLGQAHHFLRFNQGAAPYAEERFGKEAHRLYGVLDRRLREHEFVTGAYSIADVAIWPWVSRFEWQTVDLKQYPNVKQRHFRELPSERPGQPRQGLAVAGVLASHRGSIRIPAKKSVNAS
jgi:glutathione S-transferase